MATDPTPKDAQENRPPVPWWLGLSLTALSVWLLLGESLDAEKALRWGGFLLVGVSALLSLVPRFRRAGWPAWLALVGLVAWLTGIAVWIVGWLV